MTPPTWHARLEWPLFEDFSLENELVWPKGLTPTPLHTLYEDHDTGTLHLDIYAPENPDARALALMAETVAAFLGITSPSLVFEKMPDLDWVSESLKTLKPIEAGRFYVHGSHDEENCPAGKIPILIDASLAFGTGHHETTKGCLLAIDTLAGTLSPDSALDLGCGSGILAFAMKKIWPGCQVFASELEAESMAVAKLNANANGVGEIPVFESEGFDHPVLKGQKFDLIVANILAKPLIDLAPEMKDHLNPAGLVILSGLLKDQQKWVLDAYENAGFGLKETLSDGDWPTLVLTRG